MGISVTVVMPTVALMTTVDKCKALGAVVHILGAHIDAPPTTPSSTCVAPCSAPTAHAGVAEVVPPPPRHCVHTILPRTCRDIDVMDDDVDDDPPEIAEMKAQGKRVVKTDGDRTRSYTVMGAVDESEDVTRLCSSCGRPEQQGRGALEECIRCGRCLYCSHGDGREVRWSQLGRSVRPPCEGRGGGGGGQKE